VSFSLRVDGPLWREHLSKTIAKDSSLVPVIKGNGYGFTNEQLALEAVRLPVSTIAVGTQSEVAMVRQHFDREVLVLAPWHPSLSQSEREAANTTIRTLAHTEAIIDVASHSPGCPVVVEVLTSLRRHGVSASELAMLLRPLENLDVRGFALHLPLDASANKLNEVFTWAGRLADAGLNPRTLWVSHLNDDELARARATLSNMSIKPRVGTDLWLGDRTSFAINATVLDIHEVNKGDRVGYRQQAAPKDGHVLVVSGGTAHGVGLEAPSIPRGVSGRSKAVAKTGLQAFGKAPSPFRLAGERLWFAEPPHMQVSMLWLPHDIAPPAIGLPLNCQVRMTTAYFDEIVGL
jgi:hypothetical protein